MEGTLKLGFSNVMSGAQPRGANLPSAISTPPDSLRNPWTPSHDGGVPDSCTWDNRNKQLAVELQDVVLGKGDSTDWEFCFDTAMGAMPIVVVKPDGQFGGALIGCVVGSRVGPLAQARLDQALGLSVGLGRVGFPVGLRRANLGGAKWASPCLYLRPSVSAPCFGRRSECASEAGLARLDRVAERRRSSAAPDIKAALEAGELVWAHAFEYVAPRTTSIIG